MGGNITKYILFHASLTDAAIISIISWPFIYLGFLRERTWIIVPVGFIWAVIMEWNALHLNKWAYNSLMPIIPFLYVGLTPAVQLGLLGYLSYKVIVKK